MSIEFFLDGKSVTAQPGQTIMDVARANGINIPGLCGEKRISKTTSCFVCVVKDKKTGKFLPSCSAMPGAGQEIEVTTPEVLEMRRTALNLLLSEHNGDCEAPCTLACPAHAAVEEYVRAAGNGDFENALKIIKERIPMPITVGRVCPRFCEKQCRRNIDGEPVAINEFKRFADKYEYFSHYTKETAEAFREQYNTDTPQNDIGNYLDHMCQQLLLFMKQHKSLVLNIKKSTVFPLLLSILVEQTHYDVIDALNRSDIKKTLSKNQRDAIASFFAGGISNTLLRCLNTDGTVDEEKFISLLNIIREPKHFFAQKYY